MATQMFGTRNSDTINGSSGPDDIYGGLNTTDTPPDFGNDTINGGGGSDSIFGFAGADILRSGDDDDYTEDALYGGDGDDVLYSQGESATRFYGGAGNDTFYANGGSYSLYFDEVHYDDAPSAVTVNLTLSGAQDTRGAGADTFIGNFYVVVGSSYDDSLIGDDRYGPSGGSFDNVLHGGPGNDTLLGRGGEDIMYGEDGDDYLDGGAIHDWLDGGANNDWLKGGGGYDYLFGGDGDDILDGGGDTESGEQLDGGPGRDTASYASAAAAVTVRIDGYGLDQYGYQNTVGAGSDKLVAIENLTGSAYNDVLIGSDIVNSDGANVLDGGLGNDALWGGQGNDTFLGRAGDDLFQGGAGIDTASYVSESNGVTVSLAAGVAMGAGTDQLVNVENVIGTAYADTLIGDSGYNVLNGSGGADTLNGAGGPDYMIGGAGDDLLYVDDPSDYIAEISGGGNDRVLASVSFTLYSFEVEKLTTTDSSGTAPINLTGNSAVNTIFGNAGANILDGQGGADTLVGLGGDDWFFVDNINDWVIEGIGEGAADRVLASVSFALPGGAGGMIEKLTTTNNGGTGSINLTGNNIANTIYGNAGANILNGLGAADTLVGLGGDDSFIVDNADDAIIEAAGEGNDQVFASVDYALGAAARVEVLSTYSTSGLANLTLIGNAFDNTVIGNAGSNAIKGLAGNDMLYGGGGSDAFAFNTALSDTTNVDTILDFGPAEDDIYLSGGIFSTIPVGTLSASSFVIGTAALDADDRIIYNSTTGAVLYDPDGAAGGAAVQFANVAPGLALTNADFIVA